jgi:hypothetical protein
MVVGQDRERKREGMKYEPDVKKVKTHGGDTEKGGGQTSWKQKLPDRD